MENASGVFVSSRGKCYHAKPDCTAYGSKNLTLVPAPPKNLKRCPQCFDVDEAKNRKRAWGRANNVANVERYEEIRARGKQKTEAKQLQKLEFWTKLIEWWNSSHPEEEPVTIATVWQWNYWDRFSRKQRFIRHTQHEALEAALKAKLAVYQTWKATVKDSRPSALASIQNYSFPLFSSLDGPSLRAASSRWFEFCASRDRAIPHFFNLEEWTGLLASFESEDAAKEEFFAYVLETARQKVPLPLVENALESAKSRFQTLLRKPLRPISETGLPIKWKHPDYEIGDIWGTIGWSIAANPVSNYFHRDNRLTLASRTHAAHSPNVIWMGTGLSASEHQRKFIQSIRGVWALRRKAFLTLSDYRIFLLRSTAGQFSVHTAMTMYGHFAPAVTVDFACGWGDRLAAFWLTPCCCVYVGCDPAPSNFPLYERQCGLYDEWLHEYESPGVPYSPPTVIRNSPLSFEFVGRKRVQIFCSTAQAVPWASTLACSMGTDLIFTSPPYADTETYETGTMNLASWAVDFLVPTFRQILPLLKPKGFLAINLDDPTNPRQPLCETLQRVVRDNHPFIKFVGTIGMCIATRPHAVRDKNLQKCEPVFIWQHFPQK